MAGKSKPEVPVDGVLTLEDLIDEVQVLCGLDAKTARKAVYAIFWAMIKDLSQLKRVSVKGFGRFEPFLTKATRHGAFKPGVSKEFPAKWTIKFIPHKIVKFMLNPSEFKTKEELENKNDHPTRDNL